MEEYSNQLLNMASLSDKDMLAQFFRNKGLCNIRAGGNSCQSAVLQALLEVQELKIFFIYTHFDESKNQDDSAILKKLRALFCSAYSPMI